LILIKYARIAIKFSWSNVSPNRPFTHAASRKARSAVRAPSTFDLNKTRLVNVILGLTKFIVGPNQL